MSRTFKGATPFIFLVFLTSHAALCSAEVQFVSATLEWSTPESRDNGDHLPIEDIGGYHILYRSNGEENYREVTVPGGTSSHHHFHPLPTGEYEFMIAAYDTDQSTGKYSAPTVVCLSSDPLDGDNNNLGSIEPGKCPADNSNNGAAWVQGFDSDSTGLSVLPDHLSVGSGRLNATRMTGWQTARLGVSGENNYHFSDGVTIKAQLSAHAWEASGELGFGAINDGSPRANVRMHTAFIENGQWSVRYNNVYGYDTTEDLGPANLGVVYQVEVVFHSAGSSLYIYPVGQSRGDLYEHHQSYTDWGNIHTYLYTNQRGINGYFDNLQEVLPGQLTNSPPSVFITSPVYGAEFTEGNNVALTAAATDLEDDNSVLSNNIQWLINGALHSGVGSSVSIGGLLSGQYEISARVTDSAGTTSDSTPIAIDITLPNTPPVVTINSPASGGIYSQRDVIHFSATATDVEDNDSSLSNNIIWLLDGALIPGTGTNIQLSNLPPGIYALNARVLDTAGATGESATINLTVNMGWNQDFSAGSTGLTTLPAHITASDGHLNVSRMSGWKTSLIAVYGERHFFFSDEVALRAQISAHAWETSGELGFGAINETQTRRDMRTHSAFIENGQWSVRFNNVYGYNSTANLGPAELDVVYQVEVEFNSSGSSLYIYPVGHTRGDLYEHHHSYTDWGTIKTYVYTNQRGINGYFDNLQEVFPGDVVNNAPAVQVTSPLSGSRFNEGDNISLVASAADFEDDDIVLSNTIEWMINGIPYLETGPHININSLSLGTHEIIGRVTDSGGQLSSSAPITVSVDAPYNTPPTIEVISPVNGSYYFEGDTVQVSAAVGDAEDDDTVLANHIEWLIDGALQLETGPSVTFNGLAPGTHNIVARITDSDGLSTDSSPITVEISPIDSNQYYSGDP